MYSYDGKVDQSSWSFRNHPNKLIWWEEETFLIIIKVENNCVA